MIKIFENDDFVVDYDKENKRYRVSYFEDYHFKEECWFDEHEEKETSLQETLNNMKPISHEDVKYALNQMEADDDFISRTFKLIFES